MIKANVSHLQLNVKAGGMAFYRALMSFCGFHILYDDPAMLGVGDENHTSLWFIASANDSPNDYDGVGMNHLALAVEHQSDVDAAVDYLRQQGVALLFETPRHRAEFSEGADHTYYQVMFESPDHILFEIVYTGLKES